MTTGRPGCWSPIPAIVSPPPPWLRRLNEGLWNRGTDAPPVGYLDFLVDLARVEGVLTGGDAAVEEPFQVSPTVRSWRDRSFPEQTERLRATWLGSSTWIDAIGIVGLSRYAGTRRGFLVVGATLASNDMPIGARPSHAIC